MARVKYTYFDGKKPPKPSLDHYAGPINPGPANPPATKVPEAAPTKG